MIINKETINNINTGRQNNRMPYKPIKMEAFFASVYRNIVVKSVTS